MTSEIIDDSFYVERSSWGTWKSYDKNQKSLITSLTEEVCIQATRFYLKGIQEGWSTETKGYSSTVDGKL
jgi:hypothetical protein